MNRAQLEHAIRAACRVSDDDELYVFGSQAILGQHPDASDSLRASVEVDVQPKNRPQAVDAIDGALGELSPFYTLHGFYVHGVSIECADMPAGWEERTHAVSDRIGTEGGTGHCIEAHDLAASKLSAYRDKDLDFVTVLLRERLIVPGELLERVESLPVDAAKRFRIAKWIQVVSASLGLDDGE